MLLRRKSSSLPSWSSSCPLHNNQASFCSKCLRIVCVKIMQEVWRCEGDYVSSKRRFKRLKGEDDGTNISN